MAAGGLRMKRKEITPACSHPSSTMEESENPLNLREFHLQHSESIELGPFHPYAACGHPSSTMEESENPLNLRELHLQHSESIELGPFHPYAACGHPSSTM